MDGDYCCTDVLKTIHSSNFGNSHWVQVYLVCACVSVWITLSSVNLSIFATGFLVALQCWRHTKKLYSWKPRTSACGSSEEWWGFADERQDFHGQNIGQIFNEKCHSVSVDLLINRIFNRQMLIFPYIQIVHFSVSEFMDCWNHFSRGSIAT